jgi:hypothetical protein
MQVHWCFFFQYIYLFYFNLFKKKDNNHKQTFDQVYVLYTHV